MRKIIHIQLMEEYPNQHYENIKRMLSEHFKRINDDTFELKEGVFLKFNKNELLLYEEEKVDIIIDKRKGMIELLNYMENEVRKRKFCCRGNFLRLIRKTRTYIESARWDKLTNVIEEWLRLSEQFAEMLLIFLDRMLTAPSGEAS